MEKKIQDRSCEIAYEVMMFKGRQVLASRTFDVRRYAADALYSWAHAAKAAGEIKSIKAVADKDGVYGYDITVKGCRGKFRTRMKKKVVKSF